MNASIKTLLSGESMTNSAYTKYILCTYTYIFCFVVIKSITYRYTSKGLRKNTSQRYNFLAFC